MNLQFTSYILLQRVISLFVAILLFIHQFSGPLYAQNTYARNGQRSKPYFATDPGSVSAKAENLGIPSELGLIQKRYSGEEGLILHIQDAHAQPEAQRAIYELILFLQEHYGIQHVLLEGAQGKLDPTLFRAFPDKEKLREVFFGYLNRGELSGGAVASVLSPHDSEYEGIEQWDLYEKGVDAYLSALQTQEEFFAEIKPLRDKAEKQKREHYSAAALQLDAWLKQWNLNTVDLQAFMEYLFEIQLPEVESYPHLFALSKAMMGDSNDLESLPQSFMKEFDAFIEAVIQQVIHRPKEKEIYSYDQRVQQYEKLARFELQYNDWNEVKDHLATFKHVEAFSKFYEIALQRDGFFLEVIRRELKKSKILILITGGFHSDFLSFSFEAEQISYVQILPSFSENTEPNRYAQFMQGDVSWADYYQPEAGRVNLYDAFVRATMDQLLGDELVASREQDEGYQRQSLKGWYDGVIRDLVERGRVTQASAYTHYLELALKANWEAVLKHAATQFPAANASLVPGLYRNLPKSELRASKGALQQAKDDLLDHEWGEMHDLANLHPILDRAISQIRYLSAEKIKTLRRAPDGIGQVLDVLTEVEHFLSRFPPASKGAEQNLFQISNEAERMLLDFQAELNDEINKISVERVREIQEESRQYLQEHNEKIKQAKEWISRFDAAVNWMNQQDKLSTNTTVAPDEDWLDQTRERFLKRYNEIWAMDESEENVRLKPEDRGSPRKWFITKTQAYRTLVDEIHVEIIKQTLERFPDQRNNIALVANGRFGRDKGVDPVTDFDSRLFVRDEESARPAFEHARRAAVNIFSGYGGEGADDWGAQLLNRIGDMHPKNLDNPQMELILKLTKFLDAQFLAGSKELYDEMMEAFEQQIEPHRREFTHALMLTWNERNRESGFLAGVFDREPNLKKGIGGLWAADFVRWIGQVHTGSRADPIQQLIEDGLTTGREAVIAKKAYDFLMRVRTAMKFAAGGRVRDPNVLSLSIQEDVAEFLGYTGEHAGESGVEEMLRQCYQSSLRLYRFSHKVIRRILNQTNPLVKGARISDGPIPGVEVREHWRSGSPGILTFEGGFVQSAGPIIYLAPEEGVTQLPSEALMPIYLASVQYGYPIAADLRDLMEQAMLEFRRNIKVFPVNGQGHSFRRTARQEFRKLFSMEGAVTYSLMRMHALEIPGLVVPELKLQRFRYTHDIHHQYTLDFHAFNAIKVADRFIFDKPQVGEDAELVQRIEKALQNSVAQVRQSSLLEDLRLILYFQSLRENHPVDGENALYRLELDKEQRERILWVQDQQARFIELMRRRVYAKPDEFYHYMFEDEAGPQGDYDKWALLVISSIVQLYLLRPDRLRLYLREMKLAFEVNASILADRHEFRSWVYDRHLEKMADISHRFEFAKPQANDDIVVLVEPRQEGRSAVLTVDHHFELDRPGRLAKIAAVLVANGLNVLAAEMIHLGGGNISDSFVVEDLEHDYRMMGQRIGDGKWLAIHAQVLADLNAVFREEEPLSIADLFRKRNKTYKFSKYHPQLYTGLSIIPAIDFTENGTTVMRLEEEAFNGLLYVVSAILAANGINISETTVDIEGFRSDVGRRAVYTLELSKDGEEIEDTLQDDIRAAITGFTVGSEDVFGEDIDEYIATLAASEIRFLRAVLGLEPGAVESPMSFNGDNKFLWHVFESRWQAWAQEFFTAGNDYASFDFKSLHSGYDEKFSVATQQQLKHFREEAKKRLHAGEVLNFAFAQPLGGEWQRGLFQEIASLKQQYDLQVDAEIQVLVTSHDIRERAEWIESLEALNLVEILHVDAVETTSQIHSLISRNPNTLIFSRWESLVANMDPKKRTHAIRFEDPMLWQDAGPVSIELILDSASISKLTQEALQRLAQRHHEAFSVQSNQLFFLSRARQLILDMELRDSFASAA